MRLFTSLLKTDERKNNDIDVDVIDDLVCVCAREAHKKQDEKNWVKRGTAKTAAKSYSKKRQLPHSIY